MIKNIIINNLMNLITSNTNFNKVKIQEIKYGLEAIYGNVSKFTVFFIVNFLIGNFLNAFLFFIFYVPIKSFGWGFHAKTSLQCWILSVIGFIGFPLLTNHFYFDFYSKFILCITFLLAMWCWAPADTPKRPLINPKIRKRLQFSAVLTTIIYSFLVFNTELTNTILLVLLFQTFLINPFTYIAFNTQYNNYLYYKKI